MPAHFLAESSSSTAALWGVTVSIVAFVGGRIAYDWWERRTRRERLKHALVMECFGTIRKLSPVFEELSRIAKEEVRSGEDRLAFLIRLPSRITIAGISQELHQLVTLLPKAEASDLFRFTDRWSRLQLLISNYEQAYDVALQATGKCDGEKFLDMRVQDEYMSQTLTTLNSCFQVGNALCEVACKIVRKYGPHQDRELQQICEGIWESWRAHRESWDNFTKGSGNKSLLALAVFSQSPPQDSGDSASN